ncbi:unannotated protein [freshwater metagenome]|uniref:Unannotated protein n=1 Tax=freshwater metagenome TaxID=449393 RepID=A0A6J7DTR1_9ZZZZ
MRERLWSESGLMHLDVVFPLGNIFLLAIAE